MLELDGMTDHFGGGRSRSVWVRISALGAISVTLLLVLAAPTAFAAPAVVIHDETEPTLKKLETGGWSAKVGINNLTDSDVGLSVGSISPAVGISCTVQFDTGTSAVVAASQHQAVTVTYSQGCKIGKEGAKLKLTTDTTPPQSLEVSAAPPSEPAPPDWNVLWAFPAALVVALFVLLLMLEANKGMTFGTDLPQLPTTWSFKDSWASNITAGVAVVSGVVGSTNVVQAFIGEQAEASIALATVGAAVSVAFLGLGALLVQTAKHIDSESPTAGGFVLGAACTLAGAFGELATLYFSGRNLEMDGWQEAVLPVTIGVAMILVVYAVISVRATLETGTGPAPPVKLSEATVTAVLLARRFRDFNEKEIFTAIESRLSPTIKVSTTARGRLRERAQKQTARPKRIGAALL
jgi:hypothetical protein